MLEPAMRRRGLLHYLFWLGVAACTRPNPSVCCVSPSDCESIGVSDPMRPCAEGLVCTNDECVPPQCTQNTDCSGATPVCDTTSQICVACLASSDCSGDTPVCDTSTESCVGCLTGSDCSGATPICNTSTNTCVGCASDADCSSTVCDVDTGSCVDEATVVYAAPNGKGSGTCDINQPCSVTNAIATVTSERNVLKLDPGQYTGEIEILNGLHLTMDGRGATVTTTDTSLPLFIDSSANARIIGLDVVKNATNPGNGIGCSAGATIELEDVTVDVTAIGLFTACPTTIARSHFHTTEADPASSSDVFAISSDDTTIDVSVDRTTFDGGPAIVLSSANVHVTNSVFANGPTDQPAFFYGGFLGSPAPGTLQISFSTLYDTPIDCGSAAPDCSGSGFGICFDNSIIYTDTPGAPADTMTGSACTSSHTLVFPQSSPINGANNLLGRDPLLANPDTGDFHLTTGSPAIDAADPAATDDHDFDGTKRPQGAHDDLGAFEFTP